VKQSLTLLLTLLCVAAAPACSYGQAGIVTAESGAPSAPPLWGNLRAGSHQVGFRTLFLYDRSRTWKPTRTYDGTFLPDLAGRPIQVNVWYPALADRSAKQMAFADYVDQTAPDAFGKLNEIMRQRNRDDAMGSVPRGEIPLLQSAEMNAHRDAPSAPGRFPAVLYFGGLNAQINANAILAEYLASYGYVVASISLIGPSDEQTFQSRTADDLEASVRDMEFAWSVLQDASDVDGARLAVMGHSVGAMEAIILGLRNANVSAAIGLDGTYGFPGLSTVLTHAYGYAPAKMRAPFLDLRRAQGAQGNEPLDFTVVESFRHSDRTLITIEKMHHSDFTSFAMVGAQFHVSLPTGYPLNGWNRETGRDGYEWACRIVRAFLDANLKSKSEAMAAIDREAMPGNGMNLRHEPAIPPPPSPSEAAALAGAQGLDAAKRAFVTTCGENSVASCMDIDRFNNWGYNLLGQQRPKVALAVFQLNAWAHPGSANAQDSLADGYLAVGDKEDAKRAVERAIVLAPNDALLDPAARESFLSEEKARLQKFQ
jgi:pimeloyl-ACP methyl ester carboxylesterase